MSNPEFAVRLWTGRQHLVSNPTDEQTARDAAAFAARSGHMDVALLRRDGPQGNWLAVPFSPPSRLHFVNQPIRNTVGRN